VASADYEAGLSTWGQLTLEAFVKVTDASGDFTDRGIIGWRATEAGGDKHLGLTFEDQGDILRFHVVAGNTIVTVASGWNEISKNVWHHVVGTYDGANVTLYVDGKLIDGPDAQTGTLDPYDFGDQPIELSRHTVALDYLGVDIGLVRVYSRALDQAEVIQRSNICFGQAMQPMAFPGGGILGLESPSASPSESPSVSPSVSPSPSPGYELYTRGDYAVLPGDDADLETAYIPQDYLDVDTKNNVRVAQTGPGQEYMIHQFKDFVGAESGCTLECELQTTLDPAVETVFLQIYNHNTTTWDAVDSDNTSAPNLDFTLKGSIPDLTNYKDGSNVVSCRVYQHTG